MTPEQKARAVQQANELMRTSHRAVREQFGSGISPEVAATLTGSHMMALTCAVLVAELKTVS